MVVDIGDDAISENSPLNKFLKERLGLAPFSLKGDSDWILIIKFASYIEATLNFLLVRKLGDPRLEETISRLEVSNLKSGKLAFVMALDLLPSEEITFVRNLAELRNQLVHNIKKVDFNLPMHLEGMEKGKRQAFKNPIISILKGFVKDATEDSARKLIEDQPRGVLLVCVIAIMMRVYGHDLSLTASPSTLMPEESNPKAQ